MTLVPKLFQLFLIPTVDRTFPIAYSKSMCTDTVFVSGEVTDLSEMITLSPAVLNTVRYEGVRHGSHSVSETLGNRFEQSAQTDAVQLAGELSPPSCVDTPVLTSLLIPLGTFPAPRLLGPAHFAQQQPGWCVHRHIHSAEQQHPAETPVSFRAMTSDLPQVHDDKKRTSRQSVEP